MDKFAIDDPLKIFLNSKVKRYGLMVWNKKSYIENVGTDYINFELYGFFTESTRMTFSLLHSTIFGKRFDVTNNKEIEGDNVWYQLSIFNDKVMFNFLTSINHYVTDKGLNNFINYFSNKPIY